MATKVVERDVTKLPQWAQERLAAFERELKEAKKALVQERASHPGSPIQCIDNIKGTSRGIDGDYETVRVQIGDQTYPEDGRWRHWLDVRRTDEGQVQIVGSGTLVLTPKSSNLFLVDDEDRLEHNEEKNVRTLGMRLLQELLAKGLDWQDGLNLIYDADVDAVKASRGRYRNAR